MRDCRLEARLSGAACYQIHACGGWVEDDVYLADVQLPHYLRDFLVERKLFLAVLGTLAQYE